MKEKGATLTELLDIALGTVSVASDRNEAEIFFDEIGVVAGDNWVDDRLVYWRYLKWCAEINRIPVERKVFIRGAQKRFKRLTSQGKCYFKLVKELFAVSKEEWGEVKQDYNIEKRKLEWRRNAKKAQLKRRQKERQLKREARKRSKGPLEETPQITQDSKSNSSPE